MAAKRVGIPRLMCQGNKQRAVLPVSVAYLLQKSIALYVVNLNLGSQYAVEGEVEFYSINHEKILFFITQPTIKILFIL